MNFPTTHLYIQMKITFFFLAMLFAMPFASSQNRLSGNIKDELTKEALINATIYITDLKIGAAADLNGNYEITDIPSGTYLIEIKYVGYKTQAIHININQNIKQDFLLASAVAELNVVVVTAVTRSTELKESPLIIKPIDKNVLNQNAATNLVDALKNIPGVNQITTGAAVSKPTIRGLGYNRVIALYDGIRQEGQQWGDEHGIEIDEYAIDRVEIVKGAGSLMYGSDGIAGVLNFISPKAPALETVKTQFASNFQTNNQLFGYSLSNAGNKNGIQWLARSSAKLAGNYQNAFDGKVYNSGFGELDGGIFLGVNKNWGYSHFNFNTFNTKIGVIEGERDEFGRFLIGKGTTKMRPATENDLNGYQIGIPHQLIHHNRAILNNYFILKEGSIHFDIGFQNNQRQEFSDLLNPTDKTLFFDLSTFNYNFRYNLPKIKDWETSIGTSGMSQSNANKGLEFLIPAYHLFDIGGFLFAQRKFNPKITLAGGLRFDERLLKTDALWLDSLNQSVVFPRKNVQTKFAAFQKNYQNFSSSIGLTYQINAVSTLKTNYAQGFRAPNIAEISSNGVHEGTFRYEYGNANLKPEISRQIDIAYFLNTEHTTFEVTPFANFISNYIFSEKLKNMHGKDSIPDSKNPVPAYQFAQGNARLLGGEVYLDVHPHPLDWLHIENSLSFVRAIQQNQSDSTKYLPFIPAPKYRGELRAQFSAVGNMINNAYIKIGIDHYFPQNKYYAAFGTETATPAYTLINAGFGGNIAAFKRKDGISIFLSGENLGNAAYQNHLSRLKYAPENMATGRVGIYNMGRNVSLKVVLNY
jgi:iron complex outermembrane recepter protein